VRERTIIRLLLLVQFVPMVDAVLLMPLGPVLMRDLSISTGQFGLLVGSASLAAAVVGLLGSMVLDRFPRRNALITVLLAFAASAAICATAPGYSVLLAGRLLAGASAGLVAALILAVVGDVVPAERRGAATGMVMSAFAMASVLGVPLGAWAGVQGHWQWPFAGLSVLAVLAAIAVGRLLPRLDGHLALPHPGPAWTLLKDRHLLRAFVLSAAAAATGFLVIPLISPVLVGNAGLPLTHVPLIYLIGGACAAVTTPLIGRLADRHGADRVFITVSLLALLPILLITHIPRWPAWGLLCATTAFVTLVSGRFPAHAALLGGLVDPARRAAAFAINGAGISISMGTAAVLSGQFTTRQADGSIAGYGLLGLVAAGITLASLPLAIRLRR